MSPCHQHTCRIGSAANALTMKKGRRTAAAAAEAIVLFSWHPHEVDSVPRFGTHARLSMFHPAAPAFKGRTRQRDCILPLPRALDPHGAGARRRMLAQSRTCAAPCLAAGPPRSTRLSCLESSPGNGTQSLARTWSFSQRSGTGPLPTTASPRPTGNGASRCGDWAATRACSS